MDESGTGSCAAAAHDTSAKAVIAFVPFSRQKPARPLLPVPRSCPSVRRMSHCVGIDPTHWLELKRLAAGVSAVGEADSFGAQ